MIKVRRATVRDLDALHMFFKELVRHESKIDPLIKRNPPFPKAKNEYKKSLAKRNNIFLIAENDNEPVGYIYGWIEKSPNIYSPKIRGYISDAFVREKYRNRGIGKKLTLEILNLFKSKGVHWVKLNVYSKNRNSTIFWRSVGFRDYMIEMTKMI